MVSNGGGASSGDTTSGTSEGGGGDGAKQVMKKGPWTAAEDAILIEYVRKHGEGNWNAVQRNSGLSRCGKSCRLRWANHLRPNLKKGAFSFEEERLIIELHAKLGNKWARMAAQLPGRTDNEIKNYWNTRTKRRQRAGLPLYPRDIQRDAAAFHIQQLEQQQRRRQQQHPHSSSSSLPPFLSSSHHQKPTYNSSLSLFDQIKFSTTTANPIQTHPNSSFISNTNHQFNLFHDTNNGGIVLPLSSASPYPSSSPSPRFNQSLTTQLLPTPTLQFNSGNFELNPHTILGAPFEQIGLNQLFKKELPSSQTRLQSTTPASSATTGGNYVIVASRSANDYVIAPPMSRGNSGLLDDLLKEAQALSRNENSRVEQLSPSDKGKSVVEFTAARVQMGSVFGDSRDATPENRWDDSSSGQSSIGMKSKTETMEEMNSLDDELTSLLGTFPSTMPVPEWYRQSGDVSNGKSSSMTSGKAVLDIGRKSSPSPAAATTAMDHDLILGSCCWNNMPSIC